MSDKTSDKTSDRLLNCPFCGGNVCIELDCSDDDCGYFWTFKSTKEKDGCICDNIFIESYYFDDYDEEEKEKAKQKLIEAWNTRKPMERILERLEENYDFYDGKKKEAYEERDWECFDRYMNVNRGIFEAIAIVKKERGLN